MTLEELHSAVKEKYGWTFSSVGTYASPNDRVSIFCGSGQDCVLYISLSAKPNAMNRFTSAGYRDIQTVDIDEQNGLLVINNVMAIKYRD